MKLRILALAIIIFAALSAGASAQYWYDYYDDYQAPTSGHYDADNCWNCFDYYNTYRPYRQPFVVANGNYYPYVGQDPYYWHVNGRGRYYDGFGPYDRHGTLFPDAGDYWTGWNRFY